MTRLFAVVAAVLAAFIELMLSALLVGQPHPSLLLLTAIAVAMVRRTEEGALVAFGGGLILDVFAGPPLGRQALALVVGVLPVFLQRTELARRTMLAPMLAAALGTVLYWITLGLVDVASGLAVPWLHLALRWILPTIAINALLVWPVFLSIGRMTLRRGPGLTAR